MEQTIDQQGAAVAVGPGQQIGVRQADPEEGGGQGEGGQDRHHGAAGPQDQADGRVQGAAQHLRNAADDAAARGPGRAHGDAADAEEPADVEHVAQAHRHGKPSLDRKSVV